MKKTGKFLATTVAVSALLINTPANAGFFSIFSGTNAHFPLIEASELGNEAYVKKLIANGVQVNAVDAKGNTALLRAAYHGNTKVVESLVKAGANVNATDKYGRTALHYAAINNSPDIAKILVDNGADINIADKRGVKPFDAAIAQKNVSVARAIDPTALKAVQTEAGFPVVIAAAAGSGGLSTTTVVVAGGVAAAGAGVAVAAGGGGGSSSSGSSSSGGSGGSGGGSGGSGGGSGGSGGGSGGSGGGSGSSGGVDSFTTEYNTQGGLAQIKASSAYARGYAGNGIKVAVVDTGVDLTHSDLVGNLASNGANCVGSNGNAANCTAGAQDDRWHGTHVAGIIASSRNGTGMHGVAYEADILPVKVLNSSGSGSSFDVAAGINYATSNGAKIINLSLGAADLINPTANPFPEITTAITNAMNSNIIVVASAGNDGASEPGWPALNAGSGTGLPNLNGTIATGALLAVGSVDSNNIISSFSNRCGSAKDWCMVAPGEDITSTTPVSTVGFSYGYTSGTSMAAPQVSGAAAIIMAMSPGLTSRQAAEILLTTATDLGATGVDDVYGHGLLNLDRATQPVGGTSIPLGNNINGASVGTDQSNITMAAAFGDSLNQSGLSLTMLDSYDRAYNINLTNLAHSSDSFASFSDMVNSFGIGNMEKTQISENITMAFENTAINTANTKEEDIKSNYRMMLHSSSDKSNMDINYNIPMSYAFSPTVLSGIDGSAQGIDNTSFLSFANEGLSQLSGFNFDKNTTLRSGSFYSDSDKGKIFGFVNDISHTFEHASLGLQIGMINEEKTFLGSQTERAFALNENTATWFYNLSGNIPLPKKFNLYGSYNYGVSFPDAAAESLFSNISEIQSYSFKVGINKSDSFTKGDKLDFVVSQPLMVSNGNANLNLPVGRDAAGNITRANHNVNLSPTGREIDLGAFYTLNFADNLSSISTGAIYRLEPNHVAEASPDAVFIMSYKYKF
jgi:hypothetical protein